MQPIKLTMKAFGPYKGTEVIDFGELTPHRLFVISGSTGAGKTTIFDGISFALYGEASGEDRSDVRALRSHFAGDEEQTEVELQFSIQQREFSIQRQIPYKKKGNKTETPAKASFFEWVDGEKKPMVERQIVSEIDKKVASLIGFTKEQFKQIVMLPQGEFRTFLTSDNENKEKILRKIFQTEKYAQMVDQLKKALDSKEKELQVERKHIEQVVAQLATELPHRSSELFTRLEQQHVSSIQIHQALVSEQQFYQEVAGQLEKQINEEKRIVQQHQARYIRAEQIIERFLLQEQIESAYQIADRQAASYRKAYQRNKKARKANLFRDLDTQLTNLQTEQQQVENRLQHEKAQQQLVEKDLLAIEHKQQALPESKEQLQKQHSLLHYYQQQAPKMTAYTAACRIIEQEKPLLQQQIQIVEKGKQSCVEQQKELDRLYTRIVTCQNHSQNYEQLMAQSSQLQHQLQTYITIQQEKNQRQQIQEHCQQLLNELQALRQQEHFLQQELKQEEAFHLAQQLLEDQPCPVCGSHEHPTPAQASTTKLTMEEMEQVTKKRQQMENQVYQQEAHLQAIQAQLLMKLQLVQASEETFERQWEEVKQQAKNVENERRKSEALRKEGTELVNQQQKMAQQLQVMQQQVEQESEKQNNLREKVQQASQLRQQIEVELPEDLRSQEAFEQEVRQLEQHCQQLHHEINEVANRWEQLQQQRVLHFARIEALEQQQKSFTTQIQTLFEQVHKRLEEQGFSDLTTVRTFQMEEEQLHQSEQEVEQFKEQYVGLKAQREQLQQELLEQQRPDLEQMGVHVQRVEKQLEQLQKSYQENQQIIQLLNARTKQLIELDHAVAEQEREVSRLKELYDVLRGQNHLKLSFERYIQIDYLEQIIQAANSRLIDMTNGQFTLIRSDRQESRGRQSGLGLAIYDAYTGQERDVKTLSGGEKFSASLALALGMTDVIQQFQGGINIETMFIDEGFGSLDSESLQKAIDVLIDLQKNGRMIGVISHVEELKAALPATLQVTKQKEGYSTTKFLIK